MPMISILLACFSVQYSPRMPIPIGLWCTPKPRSSTTKQALFSVTPPCHRRLLLMAFAPIIHFQPSVVFRRLMGVLLGQSDPKWGTSFDLDYWFRAFDAFPIVLATSPTSKVACVCTFAPLRLGNALKWLLKPRSSWPVIFVFKMQHDSINPL